MQYDGMDPMCVTLIAAVAAIAGFSARNVSHLLTGLRWVGALIQPKEVRKEKVRRPRSQKQKRVRKVK